MKVSVVITTFDRPDYLQVSLLSVIQQTLKPFQIIVVNDGSSQNYNSVLEQQQFQHIEYYELAKKRGANYARNFGVSKAQGNIVAFLDDDDEWFDTFLASHIKEYMNHNHVDAILCGYQVMHGESVNVNSYGVVSAESLKVGNKYCGMSGVSVKTTIAKQFLFDESLDNGQDWDYFVRLSLGHKCIVNLKIPLFFYRKNTPKGISELTRRMKVTDSDRRLMSAYKHREWLGERHFKKRVAEQLLTFLIQKPQKIKWIAKSIKLAGWKTTGTVLLSKLKRRA